MLRSPFSRLNRPRREPTAPDHHPGQLSLLQPEDAAPARRRAPAPVEPPRARATDPATSHEAAARAANVVGAHHKAILAALAQGDANIFEIGIRAGLTHVQVARRMIELQRAGQARPTDERREGCRVWSLC